MGVHRYVPYEDQCWFKYCQSHWSVYGIVQGERRRLCKKHGKVYGISKEQRDLQKDEQ